MNKTLAARLFVLGASGQIGRALRASWGEQGDVLWQGRGAQGAGWLDWAPLDAPVPPVPPRDVVLVLSGVTPSAARGDMADNVRLAEAGVALARSCGARRVLLASSQAVYGPLVAPAREDTVPAPAHPYGKAKLDAEAAARAALAPGMTLTALRIGNVVGADLLGQNLRAGRGITLDRFADDLGPRRAYIGPGTLAAVLATLCDAGALPDVLNIAAPESVEMEALVRAYGAPLAWRPAPEGALQDLPLDVTALQSLHPFTPPDRDPAQMVAQARALL